MCRFDNRHMVTTPLSPSRVPPPLKGAAWSWDVFCRVVDNFGDIGVCWRLAADLAARGHRVRLWVDDPRALNWLRPEVGVAVQVLHWTSDTPIPEPGDVVVETFGCDPPEAFVARMAGRAPPPLWINLEYLSAEAYVERSHRLRSPQGSGPGMGLDKWFFYPGFTPATGGLLREPGLIEQLDSLDIDAFLAQIGAARRRGERCVSVFSYPTPSLAELPSRLADAPTMLLATPGAATEVMTRAPLPPGVRVLPLPWLAQPHYDRLLRACDLNIVRGEDSFVRAQWAGRPFLWHIYPQHDGVHATKLAAFLDRHLRGTREVLGSEVRDWMLAWNGLTARLPRHLPPLPAWQALTCEWRQGLLAQADLVTQLVGFATEKR